MTPLLSVVIPCYNVEQYLDRALSSFSDERLNGKVQVLIVNDGSADRTAEIATGYCDRFPEIFTLINKENGGHGSAVNTGIRHAAGKYFRIVDGDDWVHTENLIRLLEIMENTDADLVVDQKREVRLDNGESVFFPLPEGTPFDQTVSFDEICDNPVYFPFIMLHTQSTRTALLRQWDISVTEGVFYEDIEYILKTTVRAETVQFADLEIYQYLVGNTAQSVYFENYVKRYDHHRQVTGELVRFGTEFSGERRKKDYLDGRIALLIHTHYNIALIYDKDRKRGRKRAVAFRKFLKATNAGYDKATRKRYCTALLLHLAGVDFHRLQKLRGGNP